MAEQVAFDVEALAAGWAGVGPLAGVGPAVDHHRSL